MRTRYEVLLHELCYAARVPDTHTVLRTHHIEVHGRVIGVLPDPASEEHVTIYIDLGPIYQDRDVEAAILEANLEPSGSVQGAFGVDALTGRAAFRFSVPVEIDGDELATRISIAISHAVSRFEDFSHINFS